MGYIGKEIVESVCCIGELVYFLAGLSEDLHPLVYNQL